MTLPIDTLLEPMTVDDCRATIYSVLASTGVTTTLWKPGAVVRTLITGVAIIMAAMSTIVALIGRSGFLEYAVGGWLTLLAAQVYGVDRFDATFAAGTVIINNSGGGVYSWAAGDLTVINPTNRTTYHNVAQVDVAALQTGVSVAVVADAPGSAFSSLAGQVSAFDVTYSGLTVANPAAIVGTDAEEDPSLRQRCRDSLGARSPNGPADGYAYWCRSAKRADGSPIAVSQVRHIKDGYGSVVFHISGPSGAITQPDLEAIKAVLKRNAVPYGVNCFLASVDAQLIDFVGSVWVYDTALTDAQIKEAIDARLVTYLRNTPIGGNVINVSAGKIFTTPLLGEISQTTHPDGTLQIARVTCTTPPPPTTNPDDGIVIGGLSVPILGSTSYTISRIARPEQS